MGSIKIHIKTASTLDHCPYCGSLDLMVEPAYEESCVVCQNCGAEGPKGDYQTCQDKWNHRFSTQSVDK
ncbi:hypothetical protein E1100_25660 [Vibrio owensii]|uniref:Lar family restriction alleviation protein n=1 Tax=Vibrio owensii TaxID=696485 RepID=UPI001053C306|nr:Lar family restriction alleviation protein [Vibrio owensii]TDE19249.1 hypothetical protein E1100_25660 [Vibrio owensii]